MLWCYWFPRGGASGVLVVRLVVLLLVGASGSQVVGPGGSGGGSQRRSQVGCTATLNPCQGKTEVGPGCSPGGCFAARWTGRRPLGRASGSPHGLDKFKRVRLQSRSTSLRRIWFARLVPLQDVK